MDPIRKMRIVSNIVIFIMKKIKIKGNPINKLWLNFPRWGSIWLNVTRAIVWSLSGNREKKGETRNTPKNHKTKGTLKKYKNILTNPIPKRIWVRPFIIKSELLKGWQLKSLSINKLLMSSNIISAI